ncbi:MAG: sialidase family protein, partial [Bryobacteraceae bacterium]
MIKRAVFSLAAATLLFVLFITTRRAATSAPVQEPQRVAFLIRLGLDLVKDVDWSGSVSPAPARISAWQMDAGEETSGSQWKGKTRERVHFATPYERRMGPTSFQTSVDVKGVVVEYDLPAPNEIRVTTAQGSFTFAPRQELWSAPERFLDGKADVRATPAVHAGPGAGDGDYPSLLSAKDGTLWMTWQQFDRTGDRVFVRRRIANSWSDPEPLSDAGGDMFRTAIAQDAAGKVWVVWSAQVKGNFDLYARSHDGKRWSAVERLTTAAGSDIFHTLISDRAGRLYLAWQSSRAGNFDIYMRSYDGKRWSQETQVSSDPANDWEPALAAAPDGRVTVLWDTYAKGNYDVLARTWRDGKLEAPVTIAATGAFESRPSAVYDAQGRLWIAFDEGDWNWGKDYGNSIPESGRGLLVRRQARVAVLDGDRLQETRASIGDAVPSDLRQVFHAPKIVIDAAGNPNVFFHYRRNMPRSAEGEGRGGRAVWRVAATVYRDGRWTPMTEFTGGWGRIDAPV